MNGIVAGEPAGMVDATLSPIEVARLVTLEAVIDAGLRTFVHVGHALIEIRDNRLYRETHRVFEDYCRERWGMSSEYARLNMRAAEVISNLQQTPTIVGVLPATESQARPLTVLEPDDQREAWRITVETAPSGKVTAAHVQATVNQYRATVDIDDDDIQVDGCWNCRHRIAVYGGDDLDVCALLQRTLRPDTYPEGYTPCHMNDWQSKEVETLRPLPLTAANHAPSADPDYDGDEWYTPEDIIERARRVFGGCIDLDPATNEIAGKDPGRAEAIRRVREYFREGQVVTSDGPRMGIYLWGHTDMGKTGLLCPLFLHYIRQGETGLWLQYNDLQASLRDFESGKVEERIQEIQRVAFLFVDDWGDPASDRTATDYSRDTMFRIVDYRNGYQKPTFITSNLSPTKLAGQFHERMAKRLTELCAVVEVTGEPMRDLIRYKRQADERKAEYA